MCGIAGIISQAPLAAAVSPSVLASLKHRGPEARHHWQNDTHQAWLGHTRLSIIDLSAAAAQPLHYAGRYTIVHNGELYNYREVRAGLQQKGFAFTSETDTEVIIAAYAAYGKECLQMFEGMYAFAIWDDQEQQIFVARDRMGEKPLFFHYDNHMLKFASELKVLKQMDVPWEVNRGMLYNFLTLGYTHNPQQPDETFYLNIWKLPAAHFITCKPGEAPVMERYWQVETTPAAPAFNNAIERFQHLFTASIHRRLRSDVAIGTSLSGGLDSSAVVAFCEQQNSPQYTHKCFTIGFEGYEKDEARYARQVASHFSLQHLTTTLKADEVPTLMDDVCRQQDEPFSSASVLAQWKVYQLAKENGVTVLLDGQGADELLAGYHKYFRWYWRELYRKDRKFFRGEFDAMHDRALKESFGLKDKFASRFPDFAAALWQRRREKAAAAWPGLHEDFVAEQKRNSYYTLPTHHTLNGVLMYDSFGGGLEELLRLADRNSMAHSVEVRLPFLDHELVSFLFSLPPEYKIRQGWTKWLLRKSVEDKLPDTITWRRDKVGFEPPQREWMQHRGVVEAIQASRRQLVDQSILSPKILQQPVVPADAHQAGSQEWKYWSASYLFL